MYSWLSGVIIDDGVVPLPIRFAPKGAGHYPCRVVLRSPNDIRVYQIECSVNPEGTVAQIEFTAPVHQSVPQNIPVVSLLISKIWRQLVSSPLLFLVKPFFYSNSCFQYIMKSKHILCLYLLLEVPRVFKKIFPLLNIFILIYMCKDIQCISFVSNLYVVDFKERVWKNSYEFDVFLTKGHNLWPSINWK